MRRTSTVTLILGAISFSAAVSAASCSSHHPVPEQPQVEPESRGGPRFPAVYIDMDGTLLDSNHEIRPSTLRARSPATPEPCCS